MTTHHWGGNFKYFGDVGKAADEIGDFCRVWGRINVTQTKEKWGLVRCYCNFGIHQLFSITHPGYVYSRYPKWFWKFDCRIVSKFFSILHINAIVVPYQVYIYKKAYLQAIKKYPHIRKEILSGADYAELLVGIDSKLEGMFYSGTK